MKKEEIEKLIKELENSCGDYLSFDDVKRKRKDLQLLLALQEYYEYYF